ncbi:MAG: SBBP repeat-containing protein [Sandaracinaceae bacterium]|nr:SBBP repeat-containing protein [Sandaracinaceae bacterium]
MIISGCSLLIQPTTFGGGDAGMDAGAADASVADAGPTDAAGNDGGGGCVPACGEGFECVSMRCVPSSCARDEECDDLDECTVNTCRDGRCEVDLTARDGEACDGGTGVCAAGACVECVSDAQCPGRRCDTAANECVDCLEAADCTGDPGHFCRGFVCSATRACVLDDSVRDGTACAGGTEVCSGGACAAPGTTRWARRFGGTNFATLQGVAVDGERNVYVVGDFSREIDLGGGSVTSSGEADFFIASYDAAGRHRWSRTLGGAGDEDTVTAVAVDGSGNVYLTGTFAGAIELGGGVQPSRGERDIFLASYTNDGAYRWSRTFGVEGGTGEGAANALAADVSGNVYLAGAFADALDFGGGALSGSGPFDAYVVSFSPSGAHRWSRSFGGFSSAHGVAVDPVMGHVVVSASYRQPFEFAGASVLHQGGVDAMVASFTSAGEPRWVRGFGGPSSDNAISVAADLVGRIYVTGFFEGEVDFGPGAGVASGAGSSDVFLRGYGSGGDHRWLHRFGDAQQQVGTAVTTDPSGGVFVTGSFLGTITFGASSHTAGSLHGMFLAHYNSGGTLRWSRAYSGTGSSQPAALAADSGGHLYVVGNAASDADLGVTPMGTGHGVLLSIVR